MTAEENPDAPDAPEASTDLPGDVLEAGADLGEPIPVERDPKLGKLRILLILDGLLIFAAVAILGILTNKNPGLVIVCGTILMVLCATAGTLLRLTAKLRTPAVVLFEEGLVHATTGDPVAVPWSNVKIAYITPGKLIILQQDDGPDFTLRAPTANFARIESAIRKGVPRDRVRRGLPPKNLAAI